MQKKLLKTFLQRTIGQTPGETLFMIHHYHSITHEVLGEYEGNTMVELGGAAGITLIIEKAV